MRTARPVRNQNVDYKFGVLFCFVFVMYMYMCGGGGDVNSRDGEGEMHLFVLGKCVFMHCRIWLFLSSSLFFTF